MIKLDGIYAMIASGKTEYLKIIHDRQHDSTNGFWYVKTSMFGDEIEIENPNNLCIYHEIYKYLLNKYGEDNVDLIIPRGVLSERTVRMICVCGERSFRKRPARHLFGGLIT